MLPGRMILRWALICPHLMVQIHIIPSCFLINTTTTAAVHCQKVFTSQIQHTHPPSDDREQKKPPETLSMGWEI